MAPNQPNSDAKTAKTIWKRHRKEITFPCHAKAFDFLIRDVQPTHTTYTANKTKGKLVLFQG
jgi:hypothetical protein